ncbi:MAG: glutaredoxin family protein [Sulfuriflexus sp.]|nr:glutaredoxin family protein [Sulfuriflexus sp.]
MKSNLAASIELSLYGRSECHLCEDMQVELEKFSAELNFTLKIIDINEDSTLIDEYGTKVPVLMHENHEICHYFLDPQALQMYFSQSL